MKYVPKPVDLKKIELDDSLKEDMERISENIHETWAEKRLSQGWGYGAVYDDLEKKHPCLIPYDELPEKEKEMDRETVTQTIKMLLWMGYTIRKGEEEV